MCSCIDGRWKLGKFIFPVKHSFITWSPSQRIELQQSCILYIHAALQFREYMNTSIQYYWMSLNITVLATNLRSVMKPASFLMFVACSMKFVQNFILQATIECTMPGNKAKWNSHWGKLQWWALPLAIQEGMTQPTLDLFKTKTQCMKI